ncbi:MAG TPA: DUF6797 domain-containing protein, partial [Prosthecobacter sp.]
MRFTLLACLFVSALPAFAQQKAKKVSTPPKAPEIPANTPWGDFVEKDFPFFSSVLDCRELGEGFPKDNLTPRGLVLNLGSNVWACYDTDLLRISAIWQGEAGKPPVTPDALAPGSYHVAGQKTKDGQEYLPKPVGKMLLVNGIYPGWQTGEVPSFADPRSPSASKEEVGRGSLGAHKPRLLKISPTQDGVEMNLALTDKVKAACLMVNAQNGLFNQTWEITPHSEPLILQVGQVPAFKTFKEDSESFEAHLLGQTSGEDQFLTARISTINGNKATLRRTDSNQLWIHLPPSPEGHAFNLFFMAGHPERLKARDESQAGAGKQLFWPQPVSTQGVLSKTPDAYVVDEIPLPVPNPWKRNVRLADTAFLNDQGDAAAVTFDGDVWLVSGLKGDLEKVTWKRFASGLHEPMSIVHRKGELFVFDRNGIWKLVDSDKNQEADRYEMFCNLFAQTAETREFPNSMKLGPDGSLYISKGGQEGTTYGKHNGTVLKVAPDGKSFEVIGHGLRQPFIGVHPETGLVTASDQQGNYVPSTPIQIIEKNQFYGHLPTIAPPEKYSEPIAEPLVWIPHPVNPSGATQTWLVGSSKMGPVNGEMIHVGYNRPELFRVLMNNRFSKPQAAVMSFSRDFDFGPLNATVNPADGQLYVVGFQVWGTTAKKLSGLTRLRYTDKPRVLLKEVTPTDKGLLLRFNARLNEKIATDAANYNAERWNYKRTHDYGSPHLKLDGSTGQEWVTPSSAYLSQDGMSVFVGIPDMKAGVHQMRIGWGLESADGLPAANTAYFSPWELAKFDPAKEGFGNITVDLTPRQKAAVVLAKPTVEEGAKLYQMIGCMACHSIDGSTVGKVGPSWKGIYGTDRVLAKGGKTAVADEAYLRESITN